MNKCPLDPLYTITECSSRMTHVDWAKLFLVSGIRFFQVRDKSLEDRELYSQLLSIREISNMVNAAFVVNDRVDLALAAGADGVHLGQNDMPVSAARKLLGSEAIIGKSTHSVEQFGKVLEEEVDYIAVGPVFESPTKKTIYPPLGPEILRKLTPMTSRPIVAIGGITLERARAVWASGVKSVAVISDILRDESPGSRIAAYLRESGC